MEEHNDRVQNDLMRYLKFDVDVKYFLFSAEKYIPIHFHWIALHKCLPNSKLSADRNSFVTIVQCI